MNINIQKFNEVAKAAKARTNDKRWTAAIDKAVAGVVSGWWVVTELHDGVMVTTETGKTYHANGACQCRAYELGQPCKHRALARLVELYNEAEAVQVAAPRAVLVTNSYAGRVETPVEVVGETPKKVRIRAITDTKLGGANRWLAPGETALVPKSAVRTERDKLVADIKTTWRAKYPTDNLADALMARFRRNQLEMLSVDFLTAIRAAIA